MVQLIEKDLGSMEVSYFLDITRGYWNGTRMVLEKC